MRERIDAIDFWRGMALATIFINHIPGNILGSFTPRNFGFSDSAEAFVFLSGVSVSLAYGKRFESGATLLAAISLIKRAIRLYGIHLGLTLVALLLFGLASVVTGQEALLAEHGRGTPFYDPLRGMLGILTLTHQIGYFNILPLYIVLMVCAPALFILGLHDRWKMLTLSAAFYAFTRSWEINVPSWPEDGFWYFNPMAWQFMFALGMFCGLPRRGRAFSSCLVFWLALAFTLVAAVVVSNGFGLFPGLVDAAGKYLDWDKTQLGIVRILDFLTLAYVIYHSRLTARLRSLSLYPAAALLGRHALPVYCTGSVLSGIGQILKETWTVSPLFDVIYVITCLTGLHMIAATMDRRAEGQFVAA